MYALLSLNLIVPFDMILIGRSMKKHPVSDMNSQQGYCTSRSRRSQAHWDYAQSIAPDIFLFYGKIGFLTEILLGLALYLAGIQVKPAIVIGSCIGFLFLFWGFYDTEKRIGCKFN